MPVKYRILREPPLIVTSYHGVVSDDGYFDVYKAIFDHPDFRPSMDELCDTRPMHVFDIQLSTIRDVAGLVPERIDPSAPLMRTAVIVGSEANASVSKLYGAVAEIYQKEELTLFPSLVEATRWLELDDAAIPGIERTLVELNQA